MRVSLIQMTPGHSKAENIAQAASLIAAIGPQQSGIITLPEMWTCLGGDRARKFEQAEALPPEQSGQAGGPAYEFLRDVARRHGVIVHGGSLAELGTGAEAGRLFNTSVVFDATGREIARYRKIHLFDIHTPDGTGYRESATYAPGRAIVTAAAGGLRIGLAICYDLRFSELFIALRKLGADLIFLPAAFTVPTGEAHWHTLIRARAIETQCWVAAAATCGAHLDGSGQMRATYGHSLLCDPWGRITVEAGEAAEVVSATIDLAMTAKIRRDMPVLEHRASRDATMDGLTPEAAPDRVLAAQ